MNLRIIGVIIRREYMTRVKKKSFLVITFLGPLFFAAMCLLPSLIMYFAQEEPLKVAVVDQSGIVMPYIDGNGASASLIFNDCSAQDPEAVQNGLEENGMDLILYISPLDTNRAVTAYARGLKPLGVDASESISRTINDAVEAYRIEQSGVPQLDSIMNGINFHVILETNKIGADGELEADEPILNMVVPMLLGTIVYMFIAIFCGMVMTSVIEEKSSRIVEVLTSSVKTTELMFGKIIGVAFVAITQFLLWIMLTAVIVGVAGAFLGGDLLSSAADPSMMEMSGITADQMAQVADAAQGQDLMSAISALPITEILVSFVVFFIFGYLLYASMFAAIGSAVENESDTQQLQMPVTIPLLIGFFIAFYASKAPDSAIVWWGSMIPFTSPIVMLGRIPMGVETWELALSIGILVVTCFIFAWLSAKIYKVGILMYGKKSSWKDLLRWLRQK